MLSLSFICISVIRFVFRSSCARVLTGVASIMLITSCATHQQRTVAVSYAERETIAFTGKGAGAGIMIDSLLGGAGVAIGIAIDEGIAKQIRENIYQSNEKYNFAERLKKSASELSLPVKSKRSLDSIVIERYGFRTLAGEGDLVSPWLILSFKCGLTTTKLSYPDDFPDPISASLSQVKTDADARCAIVRKSE